MLALLENMHAEVHHLRLCVAKLRLLHNAWTQHNNSVRSIQQLPRSLCALPVTRTDRYAIVSAHFHRVERGRNVVRIRCSSVARRLVAHQRVLKLAAVEVSAALPAQSLHERLKQEARLSSALNKQKNTNTARVRTTVNQPVSFSSLCVLTNFIPFFHALFISSAISSMSFICRMTLLRVELSPLNTHWPGSTSQASAVTSS